MVKVLNSCKRKARKDHECSYCGFIIKKGEVYDSQTNVYEGQVYDWKSHNHCIELTRELNMFDEMMGDGLTTDDFYEFINESYRSIMSNKYTEQWESPNYEMLKFKEMIEFVLKEHNINKTTKL